MCRMAVHGIAIKAIPAWRRLRRLILCIVLRHITSEYTDQYITDLKKSRLREIYLYVQRVVNHFSFSFIQIYLQAGAARCRIELNDASGRSCNQFLRENEAT